jgi:hypothetical protein
MARSAGVLALAAGLVGTGAAAAQAMPSDIAGDHVSWNSQLPCTDGGSGTFVDTAPKYLTSGGGYFETRLGLYKNDGSRIALGPLATYHVSVTSWLLYPHWTYSSSYTGDTYVTAYAYKWNGSSYALVARESIPCL